MSEQDVYLSWKEWCDKNPIRKVATEPNCPEEDGRICARAEAESHKKLLENLFLNKRFEVVEFKDKYYVVEIETI